MNVPLLHKDDDGFCFGFWLAASVAAISVMVGFPAVFALWSWWWA